MVIVVQLLRGGKFKKSLIGIEYCQGADWGIFVAYVAITILITSLITRDLRKTHELKHESGYKFYPSDTEFSNKNIVKMVIVALITGLVGSALGIGGAMIMNPYFLAVN